MTNANDIPKDIQQVPFSTLPCENRGVRLGLVVLETDLTIETEMRYFLGRSDDSKEPISLIHTRIACDDCVTKENLKLMESRFKNALSLLPKNYEFDVVGYGCTSASLLIGENKIDRIVKSQIATQHVTTPLTAVKRGLAALGVKTVGYLIVSL